MQIRIGFLLVILLIFSCSAERYDILIKNGTVIDGSGEQRYQADIAISDGFISAIAPQLNAPAKQTIDAAGMIVCPGFIDVLSWACGPILYDGTVPSVVQQGITTAVFGEGWSMGPVNDNVIEEMKTWWQEYQIDYQWETLADYLRLVEQRGTSVNVASFVGATTVRIFVIGFEDRRAQPEELEQMKVLVRREMEQGAVGLASSLVYTPAFYADTHELVELARVAAEYGGIYASHIRSEGTDLIPAMEEFISICEQADIAGEVYHLKASGKENWSKLPQATAMIEEARSRGLKITADIYPYTAGATGLSAMIPPWAKEGGAKELVKRLQNPSLRKKIKHEILHSFSGWENFYWMAGDGSNILVSYLSGANKHLQGKTIRDIATLLNKDDLDTVFDLIIDEEGGGGGIYFYMSEENIRRKLVLPWVSFCTDEDAYQPEGLMGKRNPHPRAYGTFPKILGQFVREEQLLSLEQAIHKACGLPAQTLGLTDRGFIKTGLAADLVIFDPQTVKDKATYLQPHQFPEGIRDVLVNGQVVVQDFQHTGQKPGKALFKKVIGKN